jgi:hypothetical protein
MTNPAAGQRQGTANDCLQLPNESQPNPYDLYRDMTSWYRLINPDLADPAGLYVNKTDGHIRKIKLAISAAEAFHHWLADYYHPATYAYYGADKAHPAYGQIRWVAQQPSSSTAIPVTAANIRDAKYLTHAPDGARQVALEGKFVLNFSVEAQEAAGDDTVSFQSGAGPSGKVKQLFATHGYRHQESYRHHDMLLLTCYCIVKLVQEIGKHGKAK